MRKKEKRKVSAEQSGAWEVPLVGAASWEESRPDTCWLSPRGAGEPGRPCPAAGGGSLGGAGGPRCPGVGWLRPPPLPVRASARHPPPSHPPARDISERAEEELRASRCPGSVNSKTPRRRRQRRNEPPGVRKSNVFLIGA